MSNQEQSPIYIVGNNAIAYFLAAKFTLAGEHTILIAGSENKHFDSPLTLREDNLLQKNKITLNTALHMHLEPKLIILSINPNQLKSYLTYISLTKSSQCPIVSFCHVSDYNLLQKTLHKYVLPAYFQGWLKQTSPNLISVQGSNPQITISCDENSRSFSLLQNIFSKTYCKLNFNNNDETNFWQFFILFTACTLFSTANNKNISDINKTPSLRQHILTLINEISSIAPTSAEINQEQLISFIYSAPNNINYSLTPSLKQQQGGSELRYIIDTLQQQTNYTPEKCPETLKIIRQCIQTFFASNK